MKKITRIQWVFSEQDLYAIQLYHPDMYLWIAVGTTNRDVRVIGIYDINSKIGYVVMRMADETFMGEVRPLEIHGDSIETGPYYEFQYFTYEDKEQMLALLRKAISFRTTPIRSESKPVWDSAVEIVKDLDIVNPGRKMHLG